MAIEHTRAHELAAPMASAPTGPLRGVRVIDVTHAIAGPWCGMMLADLGADVIKVDSPGGDRQRHLAPFTLDDDEHSYGGAYGVYNRNKRGVCLDLRDDADRDFFLGLVESADALIENQRAGVLDRLGLGYEVLAARNPRLVYGAVRGFGDPRSGDSPYVDWPAYDVVAQAMGGYVAMNGASDGTELKAGPFVGDIFPGTMLATAMIAALYHARESGEGQFVDVAMTDAMMAMAELSIMRYTYTGRLTPPTGNQVAFMAPFDLFPTLDGSCAIAAPTDPQWATLATLIGCPELATDERTATGNRRVKNRELVDRAVGEWAAARTTADVVAVLGGKVPVGPVMKAPDLVEDPHVAARQMLVAVEQPAGRPVLQVNTPLRFSATPAGIYRRAPRLDEHRAELQAELDANSGGTSGGDGRGEGP
ncbi:MAG: CoA transferase [Acidimicrobiia bacterium]|nr:CoA transferase [Acidimicrobiia bacterium]